MTTCESCGAGFECDAGDPNKKCWCMYLPIAKVSPTLSNCLCKTCLLKHVDPISTPQPTENNCTHCPY